MKSTRLSQRERPHHDFSQREELQSAPLFIFEQKTNNHKSERHSMKYLLRKGNAPNASQATFQRPWQDRETRHNHESMSSYSAGATKTSHVQQISAIAHSTVLTHSRIEHEIMKTHKSHRVQSGSNKICNKHWSNRTRKLMATLPCRNYQACRCGHQPVMFNGLQKYINGGKFS